MAGPGGVEEGRASIRVVPDTSKFAAELRADLLRIRDQLKISIPVELDTRGLAEKARAASAEANAAAGNIHIGVDVDRRTLGRTAGLLNKFGASIGASIGAALKFGSFAALGISAAASIPAILSLAGSLVSLVGVVALIPAGIATAVGAFGALAIGLNGFGQALKDIGDPKKFAADLKSLSPAAASAAKAIHSFLPEFRGLQRAVQQHLFAGLAKDIKSTLTTLLPPLRKGFVEVADALNLIITNSLGALRGLSKAGIISKTFGLIAQSMTILAPAIGALIDAFGRITAIGAEFLPQLTKGLADAAASFQAFVSTPAGADSVRTFIQDALTGFGALFNVLKSLGSILAGVVTAAQNAGGGGLQTLAGTLSDIAAIVNGPAFQTGLTQVFTGILQGAQALRGVLPNISAALVSLAPLLATVATTIGQVLAAAIVAIVPIIQALAPPLNELLQALAPQLVAGIQAIAPVLANMANALAANKPLLAAVAIGIGLLVAPVLTLAAAALVVVANWQTISDFFTNNVLPIFQQIVTFLQPSIDAFLGLAASVQQMFAVVAPIFAQIFAIVQQNFPQIREIIVQVFSTIQTIVVAVLESLRIQIEAWTGVIQQLWSTFGGAITETIAHVFPAILRIIHGVLNIIQGIFQAFIDIIHGNWSGLWNDVKQIVSGVLRVVQGIIQAAFFAILGVVHIGIIQIANIFKTLGGLIKSAIDTLGPTMLQLGKDLVLGMIKGISGMAGGLAASLKNTVTGALGSLGKHLGINSPSLVFSEQIGKPIAEGIAHGINAGSSMIDDALKAAVVATTPDLSFGSSNLPSSNRLPGVVLENVTVKDVEELAQVISSEQRDAAVVEGLNAALVAAA